MWTKDIHMRNERDFFMFTEGGKNALHTKHEWHIIANSLQIEFVTILMKIKVVLFYLFFSMQQIEHTMTLVHQLIIEQIQ